MKTLFKFAAVAALSVGLTAFAAKDAKEVTITGEGKCLKCALKKSDSCQNVVEVKKGEKVTLYYLKGEASDKFHKKELCTSTKDVVVKGEVSEVDGKKWLVVSEIKVKPEDKAK